MFDFDFEDPTEVDCCSCGKKAVRLTRFVSRDDEAYAIYFASYSNEHAGEGVLGIVSFGDWSDGASAESRVAFAWRLRQTDTEYQTGFVDGAKTPWADATLLGRMLSRDEALEHPLKRQLFELVDEIAVRDPAVRGFFVRSENPEGATVPLEPAYRLPDAAFALSDEERARCLWLDDDFVEMSGRRFFVRCLLPIKIPGGEVCNFGIWVEVDRLTFTRVRGVWRTPRDYLKLRFEGRLANAIPELGQAQTGALLELATASARVRPHAVGSGDEALAGFLERGWSAAEYRAFARGRGLV